PHLSVAPEGRERRCQPRHPGDRGRRIQVGALEHDPEKWIPVFGKDHAPTKKQSGDDDSKKNHCALNRPMTIEDDISFFERVPTLNLLGRQALRILAIGAQTRYVHGGEVLYGAGEEADGGFVIQEGRFSLAPAASEDSRAIEV